jgi:hypothetical protein
MCVHQFSQKAPKLSFLSIEHCIFILINWVQLPKLQRTTKLAMREWVEANDVGAFWRNNEDEGGGQQSIMDHEVLYWASRPRKGPKYMVRLNAGK